MPTAAFFHEPAWNFVQWRLTPDLLEASPHMNSWVLANTGEEVIVFDPLGSYAANVERAETVPPATSENEKLLSMEKVSTPNAKSCRRCERSTQS